MQKLINLLLFRVFRLNRTFNRLLDCVKREAADEFLELLLKLMRLAFLVDPDYRKNLHNFEANYLFASRDGAVAVSVLFKDGKMKVKDHPLPDPTVSVHFRDYKSMMEFLLAREQNLLDAILHQKVTFDGNLNYLSKFVYMAKHLQLSLSGAA